MQFDANELLLFARVAESGSLTRAAGSLGLPTSTLSRRMAALEKRLGERLLVRGPRQVALTGLGEAVLEHARQVAEGVAETERLAEHRQVQPSGRLRVAMPADVAHQLLAPFLAEFALAYPRIDLEIDVSMRRIDLLAERFDVAIEVGEPPVEPALVVRRFAQLEGALYASPSYLREHGTPHAPEDLDTHAGLAAMHGENTIPWRLRRGAQAWSGLPGKVVRVNSPDLMLRLAMRGAGLAPAEERIAEMYASMGHLVRVLPEWPHDPVAVWLVYPERRLLPSRTRAFVDGLVGRFKR